MRQWKVGRISMALSLILLGIILLVSQFTDFSGVNLLVNWWPVILILLGSEILLAAYFSKQENPRLKYDFFSVIMVVFVGVVSLGIHAINTSGIIDEINEAANLTQYNIAIPEKRLEIPDNVKKIVFSGEGPNLTIRSGENLKEIVSFGQVNVIAPTQEEARQFVTQGGWDYYYVGDSLFLEIKNFPRERSLIHDGRRVYNNSITIVVPHDKNLEFIKENRYSSLDIVIESLKANWWINNNGYTNVMLGENVDVKVKATTSEELKGNITWQLSKKEGVTETTEKYEKENSGTISYGKGIGILQLFSDDNIEVNKNGI